MGNPQNAIGGGGGVYSGIVFCPRNAAETIEKAITLYDGASNITYLGIMNISISPDSSWRGISFTLFGRGMMFGQGQVIYKQQNKFFGLTK